ncbi:MAG: aminopeptidase P family protein [Bacteroidota bacterium]
MFSKSTYASRRNELKKLVEKGIIIFLGNNESPMNYSANTYKFRQDSNFLYYFGLDKDGLNAAIDLDSGEDILFGEDRCIDDVVWMGPEQPFKNMADSVGVAKILPPDQFKAFVENAVSSGRRVHFLPQYRAEQKIDLFNLLGIHPAVINKYASVEFTKAVVIQRSIKTDEEITQIEKALDISYEMNTTAMRLSKAGMKEKDIFGIVEGIALSRGNGVSFPIIFSVRGETLHNHNHENIMKDGDLLILDSGAESEFHYASDITRTFPVSGKYSGVQKDIYNIVLESQLKSISLIQPGKSFKEIHLECAKVIAEGLKSVGLLKGNMDDAVAQGAHALFFPHGLGHMLGLDVHDMEALGENLIGYDESITRSEQFGLAYLRMAKKLEPGFVVTVETGIYFIPQLIKNWNAENKFVEFINYDELEKFLNFGGIRIEDDVLVTQNGNRVLGKPIPKTVDDVESACSN